MALTAHFPHCISRVERQIAPILLQRSILSTPESSLILHTAESIRSHPPPIHLCPPPPESGHLSSKAYAAWLCSPASCTTVQNTSTGKPACCLRLSLTCSHPSSLVSLTRWLLASPKEPGNVWRSRLDFETAYRMAVVNKNNVVFKRLERKILKLLTMKEWPVSVQLSDQTDWNTHTHTNHEEHTIPRI